MCGITNPAGTLCVAFDALAEVLVVIKLEISRHAKGETPTFSVYNIVLLRTEKTTKIKNLV